MERIAQGAEAVIVKDEDVVIKDRISKSYRHPEIDEKLRKFRTKRESKILKKLQLINFPAPKLKDFCDKKMKIEMEFLEGSKVRDVLHENPERLSEEIGKKIGILHSNDIIHADLTTSNMILDDEIKFIDFGLSFFSTKVEDKAVDLHLLKRALDSKHFEIADLCFKAALKGYSKSYSDYENVLERLKSLI